MLRNLLILALLLLSLAPFTPSPAAAQPGVVQEHLRFEQIVAVMGGEDGKITEDQVEAFLRAKAKERLSQLPQNQRTSIVGSRSEDDFVDDFARKQTLRVIGTLSIREDRVDNVIEERDLRQLEMTRLDPPLPSVFRDLLPSENALPQVTATPAMQRGAALVARLDQMISIRQSFLDEQGIAKPATFSWTRFGKSDETLEAGRDRSKFEIRGAVTFEPMAPWRHEGGAVNLAVSPIAVFEVDTSSEAKDKRDSLIHRVGFQSVLYRDLRKGHNFDLTVDYRTDRDYRSDVLGWTVQYSPNAFDIGIGQWAPVRASFAHYRWRPFLGISAANVQDPGGNADLQSKKDITNVFARLTAAVLLGSRVKITPEATWLVELENDDEDHTAYGIAAQWIFDPQEHVSLLVSYEHGESAPTFKKKDVTKLALGLKF